MASGVRGPERPVDATTLTSPSSSLRLDERSRYLASDCPPGISEARDKESENVRWHYKSSSLSLDASCA